jgi:hypothetical protein
MNLQLECKARLCRGERGIKGLWSVKVLLVVQWMWMILSCWYWWMVREVDAEARLGLSRDFWFPGVGGKQVEIIP